MICCERVGVKKSIHSNHDNKFEIIHQEQRGDTLEIVSTNRELFFPFGQCTTPSELLLRYPFVLTAQYKSRDDKNIFLYTLGHNRLRFILTEDEFDDNSKMMIVDAKIIDHKLKIRDDIYVGMSKDELVNILCGSICKEQIDKINSITLISGVSGIWYYYTLIDGKLVSVMIKTDYSID